MTKVDFGVAFFLIMAAIIFSLTFVSASMNNDFNHFNSKKVDKEASSITTQLFDINDNNSLVSEFKQIQISLTEVGMLSHTSVLEFGISPVVNKVHVYDKRFNEIASVVEDTDKTKVSFSLGFSSGEKKYVSIIYEGSNTDYINYTSNVTENNVTSVIVSEKEIRVLSQNECSYLQSLSSNDFKNIFGFTENLKIDNICVYGPNPPSSANIIVKTIPTLVEGTDEIISNEKIKIMVW